MGKAGVTSVSTSGVCVMTGVCGADDGVMPRLVNIGLLIDTVVKVTGLTDMVIGCCVVVRTADVLMGCEVVNTAAVLIPAGFRLLANTAWAKAAAPGVLGVIVFWWLSDSCIGERTTWKYKFVY